MLDRIIPGLTVLLRQAGMRCHPAHPLLAPLRAIDHLRQVFVQNASLKIQSWGPVAPHHPTSGQSPSAERCRQAAAAGDMGQTHCR